MAEHSISLTATEESIYIKYCALTGKTDVEVMADLKAALKGQVIQSINDAGKEKFSTASIADKLAFLEQ